MPTLMVCMAMLVQPACILYTRMVMQAAAAEGCRLISTPPALSGVLDRSYEAYVAARLAAVPDADIFHKGGEEGWDIEVVLPGEGGPCVSIETSVAPLPFLGVLPALLGDSDGDGGVVLRVEVATRARPSWLEGDYLAWSSMWD